MFQKNCVKHYPVCWLNKDILKKRYDMKNTLVELLQKYKPIDSWEQQCKKRMLKFIEDHEDCFERSLAIGHFTGSAWLLSHDQSKVLLMHHAKLDKWVQLGGHCDGDSDVLNVALKEAQEESGIEKIVPVHNEIYDIDIHLVPARGNQDEHYHYDVRFLLQVIGNETVVQNREAKELCWKSKDLNELPTTSRSVVRMFEKWLRI
jgi:8-oxo-dGTP pyrophosphatase MutT (NUDIX family)